MSAMTEARLAIIERDVKNNGVCCNKCATDFILELTAEIRRLRECIAEAPQPTGYALTDYQNIKQWQREALGGGE